MKTDDDFKPFDDVADSMSAASGRTGIPMEKLKGLKRSGCRAFRGSRVNLTELVEAIKAEERPPSLSEALLSIVKQVAETVAARLPQENARFKADCCKMTETTHMGFGCALAVLAPDEADDFLPKSAALFESVFNKKRPAGRSIRDTRR